MARGAREGRVPARQGGPMMRLHSVVVVAVLSASCGGDGSSSYGVGDESSSYGIGGTVTGLGGSELVLVNNGSDRVAVQGNGPFVFPARLAKHARYDVTIEAQPGWPAQACTISGACGEVGAGDVTTVAVSCRRLAVYFSRWEGDAEYRLWRTDGTEAGTHAVVGDASDDGSSPKAFSVWDDRLYFAGKGTTAWAAL